MSTSKVQVTLESLVALGQERDDALAEVVRLKDIIASIADGEECWFDHHGGCQEHGYLSLNPGERCPMGEANEIAKAMEGS